MPFFFPQLTKKKMCFFLCCRTSSTVLVQSRIRWPTTSTSYSQWLWITWSLAWERRWTVTARSATTGGTSGPVAELVSTTDSALNYFEFFFFPPLTPHSRSRETSFTVCVRRRSRRRARTVWATRDGAHSVPKSSRNWAFLWDSTVKIHRDIGLERWANLCSILVWRSQNNSNPGQDLVRTPPGLLALDTMFYFATRYPDAYSRVSVASPKKIHLFFKDFFIIRLVWCFFFPSSPTVCSGEQQQGR